MAIPVTAAVTVVGNLSIDVIDDQPPSAGGCPSFAGVALADLGDNARIVTAAASRDIPLFDDMLQALLVPYDIIVAEKTCSFSFNYGGGENRVMSVDAIGPSWTAESLNEFSGWVHVAALLRSDFPLDTLEMMAENGCHISYDGQGLIRVPKVGPLRYDTEFDRAMLRSISVLKLADEEASVLAGGRFDGTTAEALGVGEILVTHGSAGCDLYLDAKVTHIPAAWQVHGVNPTGAGDMFSTSYVAARAQEYPPLEAATRASKFVAAQLQARRVDPTGKLEGTGPGHRPAERIQATERRNPPC